MTKMIKMSLVAAVAVAGLSSTVAAKPLEDAIKGVNVTGYVQYRMNKTLDNGSGNATEAAPDVEYRAFIKAPVNDQTTAKLVLADDANVAGRLRLGEANFIINQGGATIIAGLQAVPTPFVDPTVSKGNGLVALVPAGDVTLAAGYFYNEIGLDNNLMAIGAIGKAGNVSYQAWYASLDDTTENGTSTDTVTPAADVQAMAVIVNTKVNGLAVEAAYASKDGDCVADAQTQMRAVVSGKADKISYTAGVVLTGSNGGNVAIANASDSKVDFGSSKIAASSATPSSTILYASVGTALTPKIGASVSLLTGSGDKLAGTNEDSVSDLELKITCTQSKNFSTYARYNTTSVYGVDADYLRLQAKYTF